MVSVAAWCEMNTIIFKCNLKCHAQLGLKHERCNLLCELINENVIKVPMLLRSAELTGSVGNIFLKAVDLLHQEP